MLDDAAQVTNLTLQSPRPKSRRGLRDLGTAPILPQFTIGPENRLVRELFDSDTVSNLSQRSPVLLFGASGTGKTTLALTLIARWLNQDISRTFEVVSATDFARSLHHALEADDMPRFRNQFRSCQALLLDNIHELRGKDSVQSELIELFNNSEQNQTLVICTTQYLPTCASGWNDALVSRLLSGYSLEIHFPSPAIRCDLLRKISELAGLTVDQSELDKLNARLPEQCSALQLKGIVSRWKHHQRIEESLHQSISPNSIEHLVVNQQKLPPTPPEIAKNVARELQQTFESMKGPSRKAGVVRARGLAMYLIRKWTQSSFQHIGELFGGRDHTTVMHACRKIEEDLENDPELLQCSERLRQKLL